MAAKTVRLRAIGKQRYDGRSILVGEEFDATEEEAADLCMKGIGGLALAERVGAPGDPPAEPAETKTRYRRRDLRAEE